MATSDPIADIIGDYRAFAAMLSVSVAEYDIADVRPLFGKGRT